MKHTTFLVLVTFFLAAGGCALPPEEKIISTDISLHQKPPPSQALTVESKQSENHPDTSSELIPLHFTPAFLPILPDVGDAGPALSVEQAVFSALRYNQALIVEQLNPVVEGTFIDEELALFDPVVFAEGGFERYRDRSLDDISARFFSIDGTSRTVKTGITTRFPTGTEVTVDLSLESSDSESSDYSDETRAGLSLTQALLRDADAAANLAAIRRARVNALASDYELRGFTENLIAVVENDYWQFALATRQVEIYEESQMLAARQLEDIRARIQAGQLAETEEAVADAELALRKQQLIDSRSEREKARLSLIRLITPPSPRNWKKNIRVSDQSSIPEVLLGTAEEHETLAFRLRPDLNEARLRAQEGKLETVQTSNGLLPRLDLFISLGKTGYSQSFGDSFTDLNGPGYDFFIGLDFEFPPDNRKARALDLRARAEYRQALLSIENLKQLISFDVRNGLLEADRQLKQIDASRSRRILQQEVVRAETIRFDVGTATALDVARAQRDLLESRINEIEAIIKYRQSVTGLYLLDGSLLLRRGIQTPGAEMIILGREQ